MDKRRWCPLWNKKFPSFHHDPVKNFTYCRLCRNSKVQESRDCLWGVGLWPPMSGWRVRRLIRHLSSKVHKLAVQSALDTCKQVMDYCKNHPDIDMQSSAVTEMFGTPYDLFGNTEQLTTEEPFSFKEITRLISLENMTIKAYAKHSNRSTQKSENNRKRLLSSEKEPYDDRPSMVVKTPKILNRIPNVEDLQQQFLSNGELLYNDRLESSSPVFNAASYNLMNGYQSTSDSYHCGQSISEADMSNPEEFNAMNKNTLPFQLDDSTAYDSLANTIQVLVDGQARLSAAVENLVEVQREMLGVFCRIADTLGHKEKGDTT